LGIVVVGATVVDVVPGRLVVVEGLVVDGAVVVVGGSPDAAATAPADTTGALASAIAMIDLHLTSQRG
jgi:hypothetical protein